MRTRAFTIIELLVTLGIITLLITGASVYFGSAQVTARDARRLSDVSLIGKMIDTATAVSRGTYPVFSSTVATVCADELANGASAGLLDYSTFHGTGSNAIPKDPAPVHSAHPASGHCTDTSYGYIYSTKAPSGQQATEADSLHRGYVLEVALEKASGSSQSQFISDPAGAPAQRHGYVLQGPYAP